VAVWGVTLTFALLALSARFDGGPEASVAGVVAEAAPWIAWLSAVPLALAAALDHAAADRREGIVALAAARGISPSGLASARVLAAMAEITSAIGVPLVFLAIVTAAIAGSVEGAREGLAAALGAITFAAATGVTLGGIGAACARAGGPRGRTLFAAVILGPWILADLAGYGAWSIPGALSAVLSFTLRRGA
jgi:hypothetical protein